MQSPWIHFLPLLLPFRKGKNTSLAKQICENQSANRISYGRVLRELTAWVPGEAAWEGALGWLGQAPLRPHPWLPRWHQCLPWDVRALCPWLLDLGKGRK